MYVFLIFEYAKWYVTGYVISVRNDLSMNSQCCYVTCVQGINFKNYTPRTVHGTFLYYKYRYGNTSPNACALLSLNLFHTSYCCNERVLLCIK